MVRPVDDQPGIEPIVAAVTNVRSTVTLTCDRAGAGLPPCDATTSTVTPSRCPAQPQLLDTGEIGTVVGDHPDNLAPGDRTRDVQSPGTR